MRGRDGGSSPAPSRSARAGRSGASGSRQIGVPSSFSGTGVQGGAAAGAAAARGAGSGAGGSSGMSAGDGAAGPSRPTGSAAEGDDGVALPPRTSEPTP